MHICMQTHNDAIKTSGHSSLEKYTSHFIGKGSKGLLKVLLFERWVGDWKELQHIDPTLMGITTFLCRSPGLLNRGPGGPASLGHDPHSSIFSPTPTAQSGVLRAPSAGCWFSLQHLISNWLELPVHRVILLFYAHSIQTVDSQGYPLDTFDRMYLLSTQVHFLFWLLGRGQYATSAKRTTSPIYKNLF